MKYVNPRSLVLVVLAGSFYEQSYLVCDVFMWCLCVYVMCGLMCICDLCSTMEELDVPQMRREVESLQYQLSISREKSSITVTEYVYSTIPDMLYL